MKVAILSSYTLDLLAKDLRNRLNSLNISAEFYLAPFNQYRQEILGIDSPSQQFHPDVVLLALSADEFLHDNIQEILELIQIASNRFATSMVLVHNCAQVQREPMQFLEWNVINSSRLISSNINCSLAKLTQTLPNVRVLDLEGLVSHYGVERMFDARFYYLAKMQFSSFGTMKVGEQLTSALLAITGKRKKCLALDLDNTLWGGIIGEDGVEHIRLGNDGEGKAFYDFQRYILKLYNTGTILVLCSKNDEELALEAIDAHPEMLLRKKYFAAWRINWLDKAENLRSLAKELNIGLDAFVFLDDSAHERELIRAELPEVTVPDLPQDFSDYPSFLASLPYFETFTVTEEDNNRGEMYVQERERKEMQKGATTMEEALALLHIKVLIQRATSFTIPRIAQLIQKTNQFNLTTRRYTEAEIRTMANDPNYRVLTISATDRLGDSGIVGVAIIHFQNRTAILDTLLMSCRILGRGIEQSFLGAIRKIATEWGASSLIADYIPTKKNGMAKDFLSTNGFVFNSDRYISDTHARSIFPQWITVEYGNI